MWSSVVEVLEALKIRVKNWAGRPPKCLMEEKFSYWFERIFCQAVGTNCVADH